MSTFKSICVLGGIENEEDTEFRPTAIELGKAIADRKINLVYRGGVRGLQGWAAISAVKGGGKVISITLNNGNTSNITYGEQAKVQTEYQRFGTMFINADAFIVLPGGLETLEQIVNFIFWAYRNVPQKTIGLLSVNGYYDHLISFLDCAVEQKFMKPEMRRIIVSGSTVEQLFELWQCPPVKQLQMTSQEIQHIGIKRKNSEPDTTMRL